MNLADSCQAILRDCLYEGDSSSEESIHQVRVATKKLRAAWGLAQFSVGRDLVKLRKAALRDLSASLSRERDRAVLIALAEEMELQHPDAPFSRVKEFLTATGESDQEIQVPEINGAIEDEMLAWEKASASFTESNLRTMRRCIRRNKNRARRKTFLAIADSDAEIWHDWRKAVKRLRYQRELLAGLQGRKSGKFNARITRLGTRLGQRNDLVNLTRAIDGMKENSALTGREYGQLRSVIGSVEQGIQKNCRRLGRIAFLRKS